MRPARWVDLTAPLRHVVDVLPAGRHYFRSGPGRSSPARDYVARMLVIGAALVACPTAPAGAQQPTFSTTTELVTLGVTVLDRNRQPVRGLTADDFIVLDEGEERPVVALSVVEVPRLRPATRPVWTDTAVLDVVTNAPTNGRMVAIVFGSPIGRGWPADRARRIAAQVIDQLGPDDMAAVVYNDRLGTPINFTRDRARLRAAIQSPVLAVASAGACFCGLCHLESLLLIARVLEPVRDVPKMVVYIGPDIPLIEDPGADCFPYLQPVEHEMFRALQLAHIPVHAVDPLGVRTPGVFRADNRSIPFGAGGRGPDFSRLRRLSENTGGRLVVGTNQPDEMAPAIFDESGVQYLIGFTPRAQPSRDPLQRVTVRVRQENLTVIAPSGYHRPYDGRADRVPLDPVKAAAAATISAGARAVADLRPVPDIVMRAAVTPVPDPAQRDRAFIATVLGIDFPVSEPAPITADVEVSAYDSDGRQHGIDRQTLTVTPTPGATVLVVDVLSKLLLRPGTYEIRASAVTGRREVGSVYTHVDVDDIAGTPLAVSGLLLQCAYRHAGGALRLVGLGLFRPGRAGNVQMYPRQSVGELANEERSRDGASRTSPGVGEVGNLALELLAVVVEDRHRPGAIAGARARLPHHLHPRLGRPEQAGGRLAERDDAGAGQGGDIDEVRGAELPRVPDGVAEDEAALGVGVEHFDRLSRGAGEDIARLARRGAPGMFSTIGMTPMQRTGAPSRAIAVIAPSTAAAPDMSSFILSMFSAGLIEMPPVSNVTPCRRGRA
jgi:VWFA-related protein